MEGGPAAKQLLGEDRVRVWPNIRGKTPLPREGFLPLLSLYPFSYVFIL